MRRRSCQRKELLINFSESGKKSLSSKVNIVSFPIQFKASAYVYETQQVHNFGCWGLKNW